jgi:hypothetical protein
MRDLRISQSLALLRNDIGGRLALLEMTFFKGLKIYFESYKPENLLEGIKTKRS